MFCKQCGAWNGEDNKFCQSCGAPLKATEEKTEAEPDLTHTQPLTPIDEGLDPDQYMEKARPEGQADYYEEFFTSDKEKMEKKGLFESLKDRFQKKKPAPDESALRLPDPPGPSGPVPPYGPKAGYQASPAPRESGKFSAYQTILIIALVVFLLILFFGRQILNPRFQPQAVSEHFFVALANNTPREALRLLDQEEESLQINDTSLAILQKYYQLDKVSSYSVVDEGFIMDTIKGNRGNLKKDITIEYMLEGSQEVYKFPLTLEKKNTKSYLFFDNWKVRPETYALEEFVVKVPPAAQLSLDKKIVSQNFLDKEREDGWDVYRIPRLIRGDHLIEVSGKGIPLARKIVTVDDRHKSLSLSDLPLSSDAVQTLNRQALDNFRTILTAAAQGKDFDTVASLFVPDRKILEDAENKYRSLSEDLKRYSNFTVNKVKATAYTKSYEVLLKASCTRTLAKTSLWEKLTGAFSSDDYTIKMAFRFIDGKWVQANFNSALPWE